MATGSTTAARPSHALATSSATTGLRTRRDAPRISTKRGMEANGDAPPSKRPRIEQPYVRTRQYYLKKFAGKRPSLRVHLHVSHFKIEGQEGSFPLDSPMRFFLEHLKRGTVPHEMMEELLSSNIRFYDGCLIVELHNHRNANGKNRARQDSAGDNAKFSMHSYNSYITPSPMAPYPKRAADHDTAVSEEPVTAASINGKRETQQDGPKISTIVLQPTDLSKHEEMLILARTPASLMKSSKRSTDGSTPATAQPPTPHLSVPPTSLFGASRGSPGNDEKMVLEPEDMYRFQADLLIQTEPLLLLDPCNGHQALDALAHPLHSELPPSPKTRKRTTAELAADDAQAAEAERRMLIMDERIKPSARSGAGVNSGENAGAAATLGFSRFKTLTMVREKQEELERQKKDEEAQAAVQRRQQEEATAANNAAQLHNAQRQESARKLMIQRQQQASQHQQQLRNQQQLAHQAALIAQQNQNHGHPQQQNGMGANQTQSFQQPSNMAQASPAARHQTPMQSSPMVPANGFPMVPTSSQQAGSPPRPTSAVMPNGSIMARQVSQQQHGGRIATPQMQHGTPNMAGAMPGRQMSQTPRMPLGSPAPGTPGGTNMPMQTSGQLNATPEQMAFIQAQRQLQMQNQAGSPGHNAQMTPEQIQSIRQQTMMRQQMQMAQAGNPDARQQSIQNSQQRLMMQQPGYQAVMRQRMLAQQQLGMGQNQHANMGQAGSPQVNRPNLGSHGLAQGQLGGDMNGNAGQQRPATQEALQARQAQIRTAQTQLHQLSQQYGGYASIPPNIVQSLSQTAQNILRNQHERAQAAKSQQMAMRAQAAQNSGQAVVGTSGGNPEYMQTLREHQQQLAMQQLQQQQGQGGMMMGGFGRGQQGGNDQLSHQMQAFQHSLLQQQRNGQGGGMQ